MAAISCSNQTAMASLPALPSSSSSSSSLLPTNNQHLSLFHVPSRCIKVSKKPLSFRVQAAKLPAGVELPKVKPEFKAPFGGFTRTAEIWNSRACMIGLIGTFVVEFIIHKGILQVIGVDVGKGLDLPL
ncbi:light-harvesting complex-like protein OHP1, chloroplastic [Diospyros lotus]|uniref:light-harvesting complex-like protein OHP1, chloroplastic n=1 Tax=Diospyros lotus TaxID=55363 RepID=UPI0022545B2A|nr:light-harvesting complex-like protein OHP1, chloroplastic [Diospyros lotus]